MVAATFAPIVATRSWRPLKDAPLWLAWVMGLCFAGAWALAVRSQLHDHSPAMDLSGVKEVARIVTNTEVEVLRSLLVPLEVLIYAIPVSFALPVAMARVTKGSLDEPSRRVAGALTWTVILALLIGAIARIANPRYALIVVPMLCPLAGSIAAAWARGWFDDQAQRRLRQLMTICTVGLAVVAVVLTVLVNYDRDSLDVATIVAGVLAMCLGLWSVRQWMRVRIAHACAGVVGVLITCSFVFAAMRNESRAQISSRDAGIVLRELVGAGQTVTSGMWVMNGPELFHYAGVNVEYHREFLREPRDFPSDRWIVFHSDEWQTWSDQAAQRRLSRIAVLPTRKRNAILAWYDAP
jgi:4-amino-4-deoxy-L-arabinose transferase-like glycosyltransferase